MDVDEFVGLSDKQRRRVIMKRETIDRKKEARVQVLLTTKEKREVEQVAKLAEKEEREKRRRRPKVRTRLTMEAKLAHLTQLIKVLRCKANLKVE